MLLPFPRQLLCTAAPYLASCRQLEDIVRRHNARLVLKPFGAPRRLSCMRADEPLLVVARVTCHMAHVLPHRGAGTSTADDSSD